MPKVGRTRIPSGSQKDEEGREANTFESLSLMGRSHFQKLFTDQGEVTLAEVIRTTCFPCYVEEEEAEDLRGEVTKEEVRSIIKYTAKYKSRGLDGWTIEL